MESRLVGGRYGRVFSARLLCNDDLVESIEELCAANGVRNAMVKGGLGSLFRARLEQAAADPSRTIDVQGYAVELLSLTGSVATDAATGRPRADLFGIVADNRGASYAGKFVRGATPTCVTVELTVQEWLPEAAPEMASVQ